MVREEHVVDRETTSSFFSMERSADNTLQKGADIDDENTKGIIPRIVEQIFASIMASPSNIEFTVKVSYMEIYMEKVRDLLNRRFSCTEFWAVLFFKLNFMQLRRTIYLSMKIRQRVSTSRECLKSMSDQAKKYTK